MRKPFAAAVVLLIAIVIPLSARVRIEIPANEFAVREKITAKLVNATHRAIAYCTGIQFFGVSATGKIVSDLTILPFGVEQKSKGGKWGILLNGVDIGSFSRIDSLGAGSSKDYSFKVREKGEKRLVFEYIFDDGSNTDCSDPEMHIRWRKIQSRIFFIR